MIILEHILTIAIVTYFLPFWWEPGTAAIWIPGLSLAVTTLTLMVIRIPVARYAGARLFIAMSYLPIYAGSISLAYLVGSSQILRDSTLLALAALPIMVGLVWVIMGVHLVFGEKEKTYFKPKKRA